MAEHPSVDDLADAAEGLPDADRAGRVRAHLRSCVSCTASAAELAAVSARLAAEPAPPMPAEVARRLAAALAGEAAHRPSAAPPSQRPRSAPSHQPYRRVTLGAFGSGEHSPEAARARRRLLPALAAATLALAVGSGGYVLSATAGLNEPPVVAAAVSSADLAVQAERIEQGRDLDPHRFSRAWFCARSVTRGRITGLAGARVDGSAALLVYTRSDGSGLVTVVQGCGGALQPSAIASAPLPR